MGKLRDLYRVLIGQLSTAQQQEQTQTIVNHYRKIKHLEEEIKQAYTNGQRVGEALARGDSKTIADAAVKALRTTNTPYYCAQCDRDTIHYLSGHCLQCGVK